MKWTTDEVRKQFLNFFAQNKHHILASASLVPNDDESLLWINSGIATLKPYFEGKKTPPAKRLVSSQKAIRTNDIENVGITARHHTFFEMLGNFSIGDYFKKDAIYWAWEFLTDSKWLALPVEKLYITIYQEDQAAYDLWINEIKIQPDHLIKGTRKTNFWDMGQGPCGPNTEIYYDRGLLYDPLQQGIKMLQDDLENDRYIEIWNIVFSQFNNDGKNNYQELPQKNIDTGAGLERIVSILQDVPTNFDTDLFQTIIAAISKFTTFTYDISNYFVNNQAQTIINTAFKIISDHIRCLVFAISDGVYPSSKGRGYIIRRLLRRAALYGQQLGIKKPFLYLLVPTVITAMGKFYQELFTNQIIISNVIKNEEIKFHQTLITGSEILQKLIQENQNVTAKDAFMMFDTYGFPIELTKEIAQKAQITIDENGFNQLFAEHKTKAKSAHRNVAALEQQSTLLANLHLTSKFIGYDQETNSKAKIIAIFNDKTVLNQVENSNAYLVLDQTPFYAERGGQAADEGIIIANNATITVLDVQPGPFNSNIHYVDVNGQINNNEIVCAEIDHEKRFYTQKNHTGTHLLHAALRKILGHHVMQSGSFNNQDYLRLDYNHYQLIDEKTILNLESQVAAWIGTKTECQIHYVSYQAALDMKALAFFGEKYNEIVRVVQFGDFSIELCGGTHCHNSKEVEDLLITSVESKGSGSYRITALTSNKTINDFISHKISEIKVEAKKITEKLNGQAIPNSLKLVLEQISSLQVDKIAWRQAKILFKQLHDEDKKFQKLNAEKNNKLLLKNYQNFTVTKQNDQTNWLIKEFENLDINLLKNISDFYRQKQEPVMTIFLNQFAHKTVILVAMNKKMLQHNYQNAKYILSLILKQYQGKGGGTDLLAQGKINQKITKHDLMIIINGLKLNIK